MREIDELKEKFAEIDALDKRKQVSLKPMKRVIQRFVPLSSLFDLCIVYFDRYIKNPLLVHGKKFDIRCYMLIASVKPLIVLYHPGYIRLSMFDFDNDDENLLTHLTNQVNHFSLNDSFQHFCSISICKRKIRNILI